MIGQLCGRVIEREPPKLILDVQGVGYEIEASMNTFYRLVDLQKELTLFTHLVIREDDHRLYGFFDKTERSLFRQLIKVNGVGPKLAITILSSITPDDFVRCVIDQDTANLIRLPGIGKKTAERLMVEMRDRLSDWHEVANLNPLPTANIVTGGSSKLKEAISALVALGYKPQEASRALSHIFEEELSCEELIRRALKSGVAA